MGSGGSDRLEGVEIASWGDRLQFADFDASPKLKVLFKFALVKASTSTKHQAPSTGGKPREKGTPACPMLSPAIGNRNYKNAPVQR